LLLVLAVVGAWLFLAQIAFAAAPVDPTPTNTAPPTIADDGTPAVGETLGASPGSWSVPPSSSSLQWLRCDAAGAACAPIGGATGTIYRLVASDAGHRIRVRETATYTTPRPLSISADSDATAVVAGAVTPPIVLNAPPVAGFTFSPSSPYVGEPVQFTSTSFDPDGPTSPASLTWDLDNDGAFDDATGFTATRSFAGAGSYTVRLRVTDTKGASDIESRTLSVTAVTAQLELMSPFPVVRFVGRITPRGARLILLSVRSAPLGAHVGVRCKGRRCPYKRASKRVKRRAVRFKALQRWLPGGTVIGVRVTQGDKIGKYTRFRIRRGKPPVRKDLCLIPPDKKPKRCPGG